jgi:hypothetical protein
VAVEELGVLTVADVWVGAPDRVPAVVTEALTLADLDPESPASFTRAAPSTPSASTATIAKAMIGAFQLEDIASRVRAAAPHRRHHSWSG